MRQEEQDLLGNKDKRDPKEIKRRFEQCDLKVKILRNHNTILQKQSDNELEGNIRDVVKLQGTELERQTNDIKKLLYKLSRDFNEPSSKVKIKELWSTAGKQIEKNKKIMEEFINKAAASEAFLKRIEQGGKRFSKTELQGQFNKAKGVGPKEKEGVSVMQGEEIQGELLVQQRAMAEKVALLQEVEERNNKINLLFNDMRLMVEGEQWDPVQQAGANDNLGQNRLIHGENVRSKVGKGKGKSKGKFVAMVIVFVAVILLALGIIYLLVG